MLCGRTQMKKTSDLAGIRGWLLLLCVSLTVMRPAVLVLADIRAHAVIATRLSHLPGRFLLAFTGAIVLDCYSVVVSMVSGAALWRREKYAVKLTQLYLLSIPVVSYIGQQLFSPWKPSRAADPEWVLRAVAAPLLWAWYLQRSRRVRNTFCYMPLETSGVVPQQAPHSASAAAGNEMP